MLDDPARVADHVTLKDQQRDPTLAAQCLDFASMRATLRHGHGRELNSCTGERAGHPAARAEPV
jgi:hypothetical protein